MKSLAEEKKKAEKKVCHSPPPLYNALEYALFVIICSTTHVRAV